MNNVFSKMRKDGIIEIDPEHSIGKEKAFVLTEKGKVYAAPFMDSMTRVEIQAAETMGAEKILQMIALVKEFDKALNTALKKESERD